MHFSAIYFLISVLEVYWTKNQIWTKSKLFMKKNITDRNSDWNLLNVTFLRETRRKCIGNFSTANVLCKQFRTRWWQGSCSISSEKDNIIEPFKELLEKRWRDPRDDRRLMDKPAEKLPWFRRDWHDTWWVVCFICFSLKYFCKRKFGLNISV